MTTSDQESLDSAMDAFLNAPTRENSERLLDAIDQYREEWIEAQASGTPLPKNRTDGKQPKTTYVRKCEEKEEVNGIPVTLALQKRTSPAVSPDPWWVISWRTRYSKKGHNRRFYLTEKGCWKIPAKIALKMIRKLKDEKKGCDAFNKKYFDHRLKGVDLEVKVSTRLSKQERQRELDKITGSDRKWGSEPFFVIISDANPNWEKVMIVKSDHENKDPTVRGNEPSTFRSITKDPSYMPKKVLGPRSEWWLDNSMMDASVQQMKEFYKHLKEYLEGQ